MFNIGLPELIIIAAIIIIVIGPHRLPEFTRSVGRIIGDLKRSAEDIKTELTKEILNTKEEIEKETDEGKKGHG